MELSDVNDQLSSMDIGIRYRPPRYYPRYQLLSSKDDLLSKDRNSDYDEINTENPYNQRLILLHGHDDPFKSNLEFIPIPDDLMIEQKYDIPFSGSQIVYGPLRLYESSPSKIIVSRKIMLFVGPKLVMVGVPYDAPPNVLDEVRIKYPNIKRAGFNLSLAREKNLDCRFFFALHRFKDGEFVKVNGYSASQSHKRIQGSVEAWESSDVQVPEIITLNIDGTAEYPQYVGSCYVNYYYYVISPSLDSDCRSDSDHNMDSVP